MANNSATQDINAERFTDPGDAWDEAPDPSTGHATTGYGSAPNFDSESVMPDKRSRNERVEDARDARGIGFGAYDVSPDGEVNLRTQESAARTFNAYTTVCVAPSAVGYAGDPTLLVGHDPKRQRLFVQNTDPTNPVILGTLDTVQTGQGFYLMGGQRFDPQIQDALYAVVPAGGTANVSVSVWIESDN